MNATKRKILVSALALFNTDGISNVSLRTIADRAGISVGNLQYHFKKRDDIIEALYVELVKKIDGLGPKEGDLLLASLSNISVSIMTFFYEYRFFLLDFVTIARRHDRIKNHYAELSTRRTDEFLAIIDLLIKSNVFRKAQLKNEYLGLYKRLEVISNFWFSSVLIQSDRLTKSAIDEYAVLINQCIYPYLTKTGQDQYAELFPSELA